MPRLLSALTAILLLWPGPGGADADAPPASDVVWCHDQERSTVTRTEAWRCDGEAVSDAEAERIREERIQRVRRSLRPREPVIPGTRQRGSGSGFFVSAAGHVLTNAHVVDGCRAVSVTPPGGDMAPAAIVASDSRSDLALLHAPLSPAAVAAFSDSARLLPGDEVAVVGYPLHGLVAIEPILVTGHIHIGAAPPIPDRFAIRIDIRRGNSGGPVLDRAGRVVGVVVAKVDTPAIYAATGRIVRDVGFGISEAAAAGFLASHDVAPETATGTDPLDDDALLARARSFVARIGCWR